MKNGRLQISRVLELLRFPQYILFRKTTNIMLNTKIILQLKRTCSCQPCFSSRGLRLNEAEWQRAWVLFHSESCLHGGLLSARASKPSHQVSWPSCLHIHKWLFYGRFGDFGQESLGLFFNSGSPHSATRQSKRRQHVLDSLVSQVLVRKQA